MQKLAVIFGGASVEHEISIITGILALNCAKSFYDAFPVYIDIDGNWYTGEIDDIDFFKDPDIKKLKKITLLAGDDAFYYIKNKTLKKFCKADCVLNCCHGSSGENGALSGLLELCQIANASPDILGSACAMDKSVCKLIAKASNIKTVGALKVNKADYLKRSKVAEKYTAERIGFPVIIKPVNLGSSIGISTAHDIEGLRRGLDLAFLYDTSALVEKLISDKKEINCAAYLCENEVIVSECDQPALTSDFLTFDDKYLTGSEKRKVPYADIDEKTAQKIKSATKQIYKRLNLKGIVRADFLFDGKEVYFNELNTVPGSLAYYLFCDDVVEMGALIKSLVDEALATKHQKDGLTRAFSGGVISKFGKKGAKYLNKM